MAGGGPYYTRMELEKAVYCWDMVRVGYLIHLEVTYVHMVREITSVELDVAVKNPLAIS